MFFDTHCHINSAAFAADADQVIKRALENETSLVIIGTDYKSSKRALDLENRFERGVYASVGLYPEFLHPHTEEENGQMKNRPGEVFNYGMFEVLARFEKTVGIGEIGLDYSWREADIDTEQRKADQKKVLLEQLGLARRLDLPAIIHCRQAHDDLLPLLKQFRKEYKELMPKDRPWGVLHCFSGDENLAWEYFNLGLVISFTGLITFSQRWDELIRKVPLENIMIETDSPYMTPEPHRGKRNEPLLVKFVAQRIAEIRGTSLERVAETTTANARKIFKI